MDTAPDRRTRKRLVTRQAISDAATRLFFERGFDRVTVDEIADAADVGRMTVFNHFPRKEDLFFDLDGQVQELAFQAVQTREPGVSPVGALQRLAHRMIDERHPLVALFEGTDRFVQTVAASEALKARARQMRDEFTRALGTVLAEAAGQPADDPCGQLAAGLIVSAWSVAFAQGQTVFDRTRDLDAARGAFLALVDRGAVGTAAALGDTPYIR